MIVLDASAAVDVLLDRPPTTWVLDQLQDQELVAPSHQPAEVLSAIGRLVRTGMLAAGTARAVVLEFADIEQRLVTPTRAHLVSALGLQPGVRVLDGLYVVLAEEMNCPLVTTDLRLARAGLTVDVRAPMPG